MGWQDREYAQDAGPGGAGPVLSVRGRSVVFWLIAINIAVFVLDKVLLSAGIGGELVFIASNGQPITLGRMGPLEQWGHFSAYFAVQHGQAWRFLSFQFLHAGIGHLLFNMLGLYFFGPMIEHYLGSRRFLVFYLFSGAVGSLFYILFWLSGLILSSPITPLVGASAGVLAVLIGAATVAPETRVQLLFPPIPIRLKTLAWVIVGIGAFTVLFRGFEQGSNAGGEAAHLGGCLAGYLLIRRPGLLNFVGSGTARAGGAGKRKRRVAKGPDQQEIDRILDKVRGEGLASLTRKEKKLLQQATQAQQVEDRQ